jgi:methylenetetrahydrofolate reductase (NADPH)
MDPATASPGLVGLLRGFSIELNPSDSKTLRAAAERLDPGTEVSLAWIPGSDPLDIVAPAAGLKRAGHIPMPHVGARHLESAAQLQRLAGQLKDAGVDRILIIGGDRDKPAGPYDSSLAVMHASPSAVFRKEIPTFPTRSWMKHSRQKFAWRATTVCNFQSLHNSASKLSPLSRG